MFPQSARVERETRIDENCDKQNLCKKVLYHEIGRTLTEKVGKNKTDDVPSCHHVVREVNELFRVFV